MKALLVGRIKKWMILALIGCVAYLIGYVWGHQRNQVPVVKNPPTIQSK